MKMRLLLALVGLAISSALPTLAQQTNTPDPQLREQLLALAKKFEDAWNNNDATALAALFTVDAVLIEESGPVYGREAIEKHYKDLFQNVHFSNNHTTYNDPNSNSPHAIGTDGNEMWENGEWSMTWQLKGGDPEQHKGYHASMAVREGGVWKKRMVISNITPAPPATAQATGSITYPRSILCQWGRTYFISRQN
jgi:ketosteroid isomerase-like protein